MFGASASRWHLDGKTALMASGFDAYHKWLSIPPKEQPPNHYRLLGLGLFEDDPDVISAAADRQMSHVQTYKNGPHATESQKLLNEIAAAKLCLLKPAKRAAYDTELRQRLASEQPVFTPTPEPAFAAAGAPPPTANTAARSAASGATIAGRPAGTPLPPPPIAVPPLIDEHETADGRFAGFGTRTVALVGSVLILLLVVAIVIVAKSGWNGSSSPDAATKPGDGALADGTNRNSKPGDPTTLSAPPSVDSTTTTTTIPPPAPPFNPKQSSPAAMSVTPTTTSTTDKSPAAIDPVKKPEPPPTVPAPAPASDPTTTAKPPTADGSSPKKLLVPNAMDAASAETRFAETFAGAAPQAILKQSKPLTDAPLIYVALTKALGTAVTSGNVVLAGQIVDELSRRFTIDSVPLRAKTCIELRQHIATIPDWHALGEAALAAIDEAAAANRADLALPLAETSLLAARKSGNLELIRKVTLRVVELQDEGTGGAKPNTAKPASTKPPMSAPKTQGADDT
ncbi:MAG TPA: hypothetical protein VGH32_12875 [Pirellulales bacterium]